MYEGHDDAGDDRAERRRRVEDAEALRAHAQLLREDGQSRCAAPKKVATKSSSIVERMMGVLKTKRSLLSAPSADGLHARWPMRVRMRTSAISTATNEAALIQYTVAASGAVR
ncbi:MAG: hypothetical protein U0641_20215 [Anaerolineae bacterium]